MRTTVPDAWPPSGTDEGRSLMETYRLKNIAIVILLLLNACLLFMVGQQ